MRVTFLTLFNFFCTLCWAQEPQINSIQPSSGISGTPVTIYGIAFESDFADNLVEFDGISATVTGGNDHILLVEVPAAISGVVSVKVMNNSGESVQTKNFNVLVSDYGGGFEIIKKDQKKNESGIATGDFNGDGKLDAAIAKSKDDAIRVFMGDGSGKFKKGEIKYNVGDMPKAVAAGDLNHDGNLDLVVTNTGGGSNSVSVLLGNAAGTFGADSEYACGKNPREVILKDFNNDGNLDIATANSGDDNISILLGDGNGGFATATDFPVGNGTYYIDAGDFNSDGILDLVAPNNNDDNIAVLIGDGTGAFGSPTLYAVGTAPTSLAIGDYNLDGKLDVAIANEGSDNITIWSGDGTGGLTNPTTITTEKEPRDVRNGDFNGDGYLDLVVGHDHKTKSVLLMLNDGTGGFGPYRTFDLDTEIFYLVVDDLDADGSLDIITSTYKGHDISSLIGESSYTDVLSISFEEESTPIIDEEAHTISIEVQYEADVTKLTPEFVLSTGATVDQVSGVEKDFSDPVTYTVTAEDGTTQDWDINVFLSPAIITFTLTEETGPATIDPIGKTVNIEVAPGTDIGMLVPSFTLSAGSAAEVGSIKQISGTTSNDFTSIVNYSIISKDGITNNIWVVTITFPLSIETEILSFTFPEQSEDGILDATNRTINIEVSLGSDITSLTPEITLSSGANISPSSGTVQDFTNPVTYTSVAENGTTIQDWIVTITIEANIIDPEIITFTLTEETGPATIDPFGKTVNIEVAPGTDIGMLVPSFTLSWGATAEVGSIKQISGTTSNDFTSDVNYSIISKDGITTNIWVVTVTFPVSDETDILSFTFPEQTEDGILDSTNHTISIEVSLGSDITSLTPEITVSSGATISPSSGTVQDFTNPVTYKSVAENSTTTQDWIINITIEADIINPEITGSILPGIFRAGSTEVAVSVNVIDNFILRKVTYHSRLANRSTFTSISLESATDVFEHTVTQQEVTDIGMEYFFLARDKAGNTISSDTTLMVIEYTAETGPPIPNLSSGGLPNNWRMISIPFTLYDNDVATMFESKLGTYDKSKWRIVHYKNDIDKFIEYKEGLSFIERGKSYWLNSVESVSIPMGPGKGAGETLDNLSTIALQKGWNQIGNPYPFDVLWSNVITYNNKTGIGGLTVYQGGTNLLESNILKAYSGGYVFADEAITLKIPMGNESAAIYQEPAKEGDWILNFNVESGQFSNLISGLGMRNNASEFKDQFDKIRVPRYNKFIDITFEHEEYYAPNFAMDIVPIAEEYTWEFNVSTNVNETQTRLKWEIPELDKEKKLILYDETKNVLIDMLEESSYSFGTTTTKGFKVVYGNVQYILNEISNQDILLGNNFPNPAHNKTTIPFTILDNLDSYDIKLTIYSAKGEVVKIFTNKKLTQGNYFIHWDGTDSVYKPVQSGIYIYQLEGVSAKKRFAKSKKMIIK